MNTRSIPRLTTSHIKFFLLAAALVVVLIAAKQLVGPPMLVHAAPGDLGCLSGYAWSDNIGWIEFTCSNVLVRSTGYIEGYAWANPSDDVAGTNNIGWISFNAADTSSCGSAARITGTSLSGWAKAISADGNGWDGCISLSGSSPTYGVTLPGGTGSTGDLTGYAWGSDVVDWINFTRTAYNGVAFTTTYVPPAVPSLSLFQGPSRVRKGGTAILTYNVVNPPIAPAAGCTITGTNGYASGPFYPVTGVPGSVTTSPINTNTVFTLTCGAVSGTVTVGIVPVINEI